MTDPSPPEQATLFPKSAGERLREAREAQGLSLAEIAARTRVPVRQLEAVEMGNYAALPSITYSIGFAKAYARAVGLDEATIGREVRGASDQLGATRRTDYEVYEIDEPKRVPTRGLAVGALIVAILLLVGVSVFYRASLFRSDEAGPPPAAAITNDVPQAPARIAAPSPTAPTRQVVLAATGEVWLKVYDKDGKTLYLGTLQPGQTFAVPTDAAGPMINVGRPDKLSVTVGGTAVAPLGDGKLAIKDVKIDAASLTARGVPSPAASPAAPTSPLAISTRTGAGTAAGTGAGHSPQRPAARAVSSASPAASSSPTPLNIAAPAPVSPEPASPATTTPNP